MARITKRHHWPRLPDVVARAPSIAVAVDLAKAIAAKFAADADNHVTWAGGVLIMAGNEIIGAVGLSGAKPSAKDEVCALDGLRKVQSRLK
jgi:uncharacterized protein GlcG (DUF336 family)